jgi:ankyrin repeat domain-containing protein 17
MDLDSATESNNDTALTVAVQGGHEPLVRLLVERGAHIEHRDKRGNTPLLLASAAGHTRLVELLLACGADVEAQTERTRDTALCAAAQAGRLESCELLITRGRANREHRNASDYTPLALAASNGHTSVVRALLNSGAEVNSRTGSKLGISPLMLAAMNGHVGAVRALCEAGADVNAHIETNRNTALTLACFQGRADVVALLIERRANVEHRAKTGLTPLMEAASGGYEPVGRLLIERAGAEVNAPPVPQSKETALHIAAEKGHARFVALLLEHGASVEARNRRGCTPLWLACAQGHGECVQLLVGVGGADVDAAEARHRVTCLLAAFRAGHIKICKYLVRHVRHFPADAECAKHIQQLLSGNNNNSNNTAVTASKETGLVVVDRELVRRCEQCAAVIVAARERQAAEAARNALQLLRELDAERNREETKRAAAQRKREKRKLKKEEKKKQQVTTTTTAATKTASAASSLSAAALATSGKTAVNSAKLDNEFDEDDDDDDEEEEEYDEDEEEV